MNASASECAGVAAQPVIVRRAPCRKTRRKRNATKTRLRRAPLLLAGDALPNAHERKPMLRPETLAVMTAAELIANARRLHFAAPRRAAEQHVPPREKHAEIAAVLEAFVTIANGVMAAMERRTDEQALAEPTEMQTDVRVLHALREVRNRDEHDELRRRHANEQRDHGEETRLQQIVEQMVAVVGPQRHLLLAVMHRV